MGKRAREARQATCAPARLNSDGRWQDVCIRNISSRGMLVEVENPPPRGHYLEVRRGTHVIIGRVVWSSGYHVGILSQDKLEIGAIVANAKVLRSRVTASGSPLERRREPRHDGRAERSRTVGRAMEFGSVLASGAIGALLAMDLAVTALGGPLQRVQTALGSSTTPPSGEHSTAGGGFGVSD